MKYWRFIWLGPLLLAMLLLGLFGTLATFDSTFAKGLLDYCFPDDEENDIDLDDVL